MKKDKTKFNHVFESHNFKLLNEQWVFKFENGYGASVVRGPYTYGGSEGLYELAVLSKDGFIDYTTPITDDVEGHLNEADVERLLDSIKKLPE